MFMQRLITSIVLVPLVLLALFYANPWILGSIVLLVALIAASEFCKLIPLTHLVTKACFLGALLVCIWACNAWFSPWQTAGFVVWCMLCLAIITFPESQRYWGHAPIVAAIALVLLPLFVISLAQIYFLPHGKGLIVYLFFLVWAADVGAYFTGKKAGRHKLIPKVSPGKSWEGVMGGFFLSLLVAVVSCIYYNPYSITIWFSLALVTVIISVFGDLFISILKRRCHLKDTGTIIPGHGGVLDRLDSLIAAAPVFYFGLSYIPVGI